MARSDKREKIVQAAEGLFSTRLYHEVTLDEVCRIAGVGKGTIYLYFKDKDDLFLQTVASGFDELCAELHAQAESAMPFDERLRNMSEAVARHFVKKDPLFRILPEATARMRNSAQAMHQHFCQTKERLDSAVMKVISIGIAEKRLRANVSCKALTHFLISMLIARARDFRPDEECPSVELILDLFLTGAAYQEKAVPQPAVKKVKTLKKGKEKDV